MMNRRKLLASSAALSLTPPLLAAPQSNTELKTLELIKLGKTGIKTTRLAQGTGTNGSRRNSIQVRDGFESFVRLMRHGYVRGIRLFDLADQYGSHVYFREFLRHVPREDLTILTKLQARFDAKNFSSLSPREQRDNAKSAIERFRTELKVDVIDILLMHNMTSATWDTDLAGYLEVLNEYKSKGVIKALGMSCHTLPALKRASDLEWVEVALTRINPYGKIMDGALEDVMPIQRKFKERGASVIGMKIFGAGKLVDKRDECMKFAQELGYLDSMTIGARTPAEIDDNIRLMQKYPVKEL